MSRFFFRVFLTLLTLFTTSLCLAGVGILDASRQTDISITCPVGVINCDAYTTREAEASKFSAVGTQTFFLGLLGGVLNFAALAAVVMLVIAGIRFAIAMGSDEALKDARNNVIWTILGLLIIMIALLIVRNITESIYEGLGEKSAVTKTPAIQNATPVVPAAKPAACDPPTTIPDSCYEGDLNGAQIKTTAECKAAGAALQSICKMLGLSEDLNNGCSVVAIQKKLISAGAYEGLSANCSKADGKYGPCTVQAIKSYCSKVDAKSLVAG